MDLAPKLALPALIVAFVLAARMWLKMRHAAMKRTMTPVEGHDCKALADRLPCDC